MEQLNNVIDKAITELETVRNSHRFSTTTVIYHIGEEGGLHRNGNTACAAGLSTEARILQASEAVGKTVALVVFLPVEKDEVLWESKYEEARKYFYHWLLNDSVYADCAYCKDADKALQRGFVVFKAQSEMHLLYDAVRWVRMTYENGLDIVQNFYELVKKGANPDLAVNYCYYINLKLTTGLTIHANDCHQAGGSRILNGSVFWGFYSKEIAQERVVVWDGIGCMSYSTYEILKSKTLPTAFKEAIGQIRHRVELHEKEDATEKESESFFDLKLFNKCSLKNLGIDVESVANSGKDYDRFFTDIAKELNAIEEEFLLPLLKDSV